MIYLKSIYNIIVYSDIRMKRSAKFCAAELMFGLALARYFGKERRGGGGVLFFIFLLVELK